MPWPQVQLVSAWIRLVLCLDRASWEQKWKGIIQSMDSFIMFNKKLFCPTSFLPVSVLLVWFCGSSVVYRPRVVCLTPKADCVLLSKSGVVATLRSYLYIYIYIYKVELQFGIWNIYIFICMYVCVCVCVYIYIYIYIHTGCFTTLGHNCRRWFPRSLWWKKFI